MEKELHNFLRVYRATPHATIGRGPFYLLFGRQMSTKLPEACIRPQSEEYVHEKDILNKAKIKRYADMRTHATLCNLQFGSTVLVHQETPTSCQIPFEPTPFQITRRRGSMITAQRVTVDRSIIEILRSSRKSQQFLKVDKIHGIMNLQIIL